MLELLDVCESHREPIRFLGDFTLQQLNVGSEGSNGVILSFAGQSARVQLVAYTFQLT